MRKSLYPLAATVLLLVGLSMIGTSCHTRTVPPQPPVTTAPTPATEAPPTPPAPTIALTVSPAAIVKGQSSILTWRTTNATEVTIDGSIGTVEASGSRTVTPSSSVTFRAKATGPGGAADAEARITVSTENAEAIAPPVHTLRDEEWFPINIKDAYFDYDSYGLRDDARQALTDNARALKERGNIRITIEGHCDERGSEAYNLALGDKRANAAKDFLVSQGIDPARIDIISYGEERPFAEGHDEEAWKQNRVDHFVKR